MTDMDPDAHRLLDYLHGRESRGSSKTAASIFLIARDLRLPLPTVQGHANQLVEAGLIYGDNRGRPHFGITYAGARLLGKTLW